MPVKKGTEIKIGVITILSILLFIIGISLGTGVDVTSQGKSVKFIFHNSAGIKPDAPVSVNGVERGAVTSVENKDGKVLIRASLSSLEGIRESAEASITILEITGGKKIEIEPGSSGAPIKEGAIIKGVKTTDLGSIINIAYDMAGDAGALLKRADTAAAALNAILTDERFRQNILQGAGKAFNILNDVESILRNNKAKINSSMDNLYYISARLRKAIDRNEPEIDTLIGGLNQAVADMQALLGKFEQTAEGANGLIANINQIAIDLKSGDGFVSKALYDSEFSKKIEEAVESLEKLAEHIRIYGINTNVRLGTRP